MSRLYILAGFVFMFLQLHLNGNLNKYINLKYAYLSESAIVLLILLCLFEFLRLYAKERRKPGRHKGLSAKEGQEQEHSHDHTHEHLHDPIHEHSYERPHDLIQEHAHERSHEHAHEHAHGHAHGPKSRFGKAFSYFVLLVPIATGILFPVATLDSSFVKAKGFSFPSVDATSDNPGFHQFLRPDTSVFYGKEGYDKVSHKELAEFSGLPSADLNDANFLKGMEAIYNFPDAFQDKTVSFDGFIYKGEQANDNDYFVFRFGFIHCVADSGVFGMLVEFPKGTSLPDDQWVHVSGKLGSELYQPFKQTIPVLEAENWSRIDAPKDPYVYRTF